MFEEHLDPFLRWLEAERHCPRTVSMCRIVVSQFIIFLSGRVRRPEEIDLKQVGDYLAALSQLFPHFRKRPILPEKVCCESRLFSADPEDARVLHCSVVEQSDVGGPASHVDQGHTQLLFFRSQDRFR